MLSVTKVKEEEAYAGSISQGKTNNHRLVLTLKRPALLNIDAKVRFHPLYLQAPLLGWASLDAPTHNKLLVGIVELSLEK